MSFSKGVSESVRECEGGRELVVSAQIDVY